MSDQTDLFDLEARMRAALHVPETTQEAAERRALERSHSQPLPKRVHVENDYGTFFFFDADQPGFPPIFFTKSQETARIETKRYMQSGVIVELKPKR